MSGSLFTSQRGVIHWARRYDMLVALMTLGREGSLRGRILDRVNIAAGESVLDVGCGTGTLAIAAARRVGDAGSVTGIDASPEMIERARAKAARAAVRATFDVADAAALPFTDAHFDVVLSTVMLHHLRRAAREECMREVRRVLVPGGRVLVVDFGVNTGQRGMFAHFHRHAGVQLRDLVALQQDAGLTVTDRGNLGIGTLQFVLGTRDNP